MDLAELLAETQPAVVAGQPVKENRWAIISIDKIS